MDIKIIVDKQCEYRMQDAADKLEKYFITNNLKAYGKEIIVVFSNNYNFVRDVAINKYKTSILINVTENLSEQHVINVLKYASDICYLKTDVNIIATRIINVYNKSNLRMRQKV